MNHVRGAVSTRVSGSSFSREDEVEDQENEVEDEREGEECKMESRRYVRHTSA